MDKKQMLLRSLPKVDECLLWIESSIEEDVPLRIAKESVQLVIESERGRILSRDTDLKELSVKTQNEWLELFSKSISERISPNFRRVINGSGVVIHTNLGRSLLPPEVNVALGTAGSYYSNLEFDLRSGKRGSRYSLVEEIICDLTGAEAALVVNNNAAAVLIVLDTLARGSEVIVSRGQLVEIGGSFRIPDVMAKSGAELVEVGATNRTHEHDYERAITENTSMLLRVHCSNFRIVGFTSEVSAEELSIVGKKHSLITMEDLGSGSLLDLSAYGLMKEPTVQEVVQAGIDVITFSGDKLLGGPQAGIIVGSKAIIDRVKKNPMNRAMRIDKFTLASLEMILRYYYDSASALKNIPTLSMLTERPGVIKKRAQKILRRIKPHVRSICHIDIVPTVSRVGGGAMPDCNLDSWAVALRPQKSNISSLEKGFRGLSLPVIGRVEDEQFLLDARTIQETEIKQLSELIVTFFTKGTA